MDARFIQMEICTLECLVKIKNMELALSIGSTSANLAMINTKINVYSTSSDNGGEDYLMDKVSIKKQMVIFSSNKR